MDNATQKYKILFKVSMVGLLLVVAKEQATPIIQNVIFKRDEEQSQTFQISDFISEYRIASVLGTTIAVGVLPKVY